MIDDKKSPFLEPRDALDFKCFAKFLSAIERSPDAWAKEIYERPIKQAHRVGITGPPGSGKSTLINGLITQYRKRKLKVGVLAVDPSSPFSQGAILGDRIRYIDHFEDSKVFIRSLGARGALGGLNSSIYLLLRAFELWSFDVVLIETVGVGQSEVEIMGAADVVGLVLVPEFGDAIQALKAGVLEVADIFIVNKSDRPHADILVKDLKNWTLQQGSEKPILKTIATLNDNRNGISELAKALMIKSPRNKMKWQLEGLSLVRVALESKMKSSVGIIKSNKDLYALAKKLF